MLNIVQLTDKNKLKAKAWLRKTSTIALDTETRDNKVVLLQFGNTNTQYLVSDWDLSKEMLEYIVKTNNVIVGHNLAYDYRVIYETFGIKIENLFDTMLAAQILECGLPTKRGHFTLEQVARRYYDPYAYSDQMYIGLPHVTKKVRDTFHLSSSFDETQLTYAALDVYYAYALGHHLYRKLEAESLIETAALEFDFLKVHVDMSSNGLPINQTK
jgi:ribonuclease D